MQKWEYLLVRGAASEAKLNELGNEGWELIQYDFESSSFYFKRPKQ